MFRLRYASLNILAYALVSPKTGEGIDARAFAAKTAARLRTYFYVPPKLANAKYES